MQQGKDVLCDEMETLWERYCILVVIESVVSLVAKKT
jgi:hypothetical protein